MSCSGVSLNRSPDFFEDQHAGSRLGLVVLLYASVITGLAGVVDKIMGIDTDIAGGNQGWFQERPRALSGSKL